MAQNFEYSKKTQEFNKEYTYGLYQIENDINIKIDSGSRNKNENQ